jgi:hypothetical protein
MTSDVVDVLLSHHALIEEQFRAVATATRKAQRRAAFEELARLLAVHETIEQELVHPVAAAQIEAGAEVIADRMDEELRANEVLAELFEVDVNDGDFQRLLQGLKESVLTHATHEERYEFPHLRHTAPAEQLQQLAVAVRNAFDAAPATLPNPDGDATTAIAAFQDQVRDAILSATADGTNVPGPSEVGRA